MLLPLLLLLVVASAPLLGGRLSALAALRFRATGLLAGALGLQVLVISVIPDGDPLPRHAAHLASYVLGGAFVLRNRDVPGLWLIGLGGLANLAAIAANGGVMPASPGAARVAGMAAGDGFANSAVVADPALAPLGDVFAVPGSWPLSTVFSAGDVAILLGAAVLVHAVCGSRLAPAGRALRLRVRFRTTVRAGRPRPYPGVSTSRR